MSGTWQGKRVLVTGGAGFVGANLVSRLVELGAEVTVLDDLFTGDLERLPLGNGCHFVLGDVRYPLVPELAQGCDCIFHLACRNIIVSTQDPEADFAVNAGGTLNVLLAARTWGVGRVVYTSSASVYGNPRALPILEDEALSLLNPYAASKASGEAYCQAFYETYGVPATVLRLSNVYGPHQSPANPYCGVVAKFMDAALHGGALEIHGDGLQTRDYTYVADVVEALLAAALSPRAVGEVFNVGTGIETSVEQLAGLIAGPDAPRRYVDRRDIDNIRRRVLCIEKARRVLRWTPRQTLVGGLAETRAWLEAEAATQRTVEWLKAQEAHP